MSCSAELSMKKFYKKLILKRVLTYVFLPNAYKIKRKFTFSRELKT